MNSLITQLLSLRAFEKSAGSLTARDRDTERIIICLWDCLGLRQGLVLSLSTTTRASSSGRPFIFMQTETVLNQIRFGTLYLNYFLPLSNKSSRNTFFKLHEDAFSELVENNVFFPHPLLFSLFPLETLLRYSCSFSGCSPGSTSPTLVSSSFFIFVWSFLPLLGLFSRVVAASE